MAARSNWTVVFSARPPTYKTRLDDTACDPISIEISAMGDVLVAVIVVVVFNEPSQ